MILNTGNGHGLLLDVCDFIVGEQGAEVGGSPREKGAEEGGKREQKLKRQSFVV